MMDFCQDEKAEKICSQWIDSSKDRRQAKQSSRKS